MQYKRKLLKIANMESDVLNSQRFSPLHLGVNLSNIDFERKDLHRMLQEDALVYESVRNDLIKEYNRFTDFTFKILTTKKLANAVYLEVIKNHLIRYEDVKSYDDKQIAFNYTIEYLHNLQEVLKNSTDKMRNYKLREFKKLTSYFIEENQVKQTSI